MSDTSIPYGFSGTPSHALDAESLGGSPPLVRERVQVSGAALAEIARVIATNPSGSEYGVVVRSLPQLTTNILNQRPTAPVTTPSALPSNPAKRVTVAAPISNAGLVWVGGSAMTLGNGTPLSPGASKAYDVDNANRIFYVSDQSGQELAVEVES